MAWYRITLTCPPKLSRIECKVYFDPESIPFSISDTDKVMYKDGIGYYTYDFDTALKSHLLEKAKDDLELVEILTIDYDSN